MNTPSIPALIASERRAERRFAAEPVALTGFGELHPVFAAIAEAHRLGPIFTPEEEAVIERQYAEEEADAQAERDRNEAVNDKRDAERARYGYGSGE